MLGCCWLRWRWLRWRSVGFFWLGFFWLGLFWFGLVWAPACGRPEPRQERPVEILIQSELTMLDPRFSTRAHDIKVTRLVHAGLFGLDPDTLEPVPLVAEGWRFLDDQTLSIDLRRHLRFHSGRPLDAADVCVTLRALASPELGSPHRPIVSAISSCVEQSSTRIRLSLGRPRATVLTDLEVPILRADQAWLPPRPDGSLDGLGPYRVGRIAPGEATLVPAKTGVLDEPAHALVVRTVRDENARALRLLAGRSDIAPNAISPTLVSALAGRAGLVLRTRSGANITYLLFQNDRPPFDRNEVRHAVACALDRELLVRSLFAGHARVADWVLPPGHWAHVPGLEAEPFDPERARGVLAGLPPVNLLTSTDRTRLTVARSLAQMLGDVGLAVTVVPVDLGVLLARLDQGHFSLALLQMPELGEPNILSWFFHPRGIPGEGGEGRNRARYRSLEAARLLDQGATVRERHRRREIYASLGRLMLRDLPIVPLWHEDQLAVVSPGAKDFSLSADGRWLSVARLK